MNQLSVIGIKNGALGRARHFTLHTTQGGLLILLTALIITFLLTIGEAFASPSNLRSMAFQLPELGILSLGMMITLLQGGVNLSLISTANLSALTVAYLLKTIGPAASLTTSGGMQILAVAAGFGVATAIGLLNGFVIGYLRVSPILATLGTMIMIKGLAIGLTHGTVISGFPEPIVFIGSGVIEGIPVAFILFVACAAVFALMLNRTPFGALTYMVGSNERATAYSGVDTRKLVLKIYTLSSVMAALAGIVMMSRFNSANAAYGESYLLITILAAVLGGVDPYGGFGKVSGLIISLVILQVISSAFNQLNMSQFTTLTIWGLILISVSMLSTWRSHGLRR